MWLRTTKQKGCYSDAGEKLIYYKESIVPES